MRPGINQIPEAADVVVVGGGLAGLTAALYLARAGKSVVLFERAQHLGGRAATQTKEGFHLNLGPHALYRAGHGARVLRELDIAFSGAIVGNGGAYGLRNGLKYILPGDPASLLRTRLLGWRDKFEAARLFVQIPRLDVTSLGHTSVRIWIEREVRRPRVAHLFRALTRLLTYADDIERQSADALIAQLQISMKGSVYYLDGGWQTLIDNLRSAAVHAGVAIITGAPIAGIEHSEGIDGVRLADGATCASGAVVAAIGPREFSALVEDVTPASIGLWAQPTPVRMASLDLGLRRLPRRQKGTVLGLDQPLYFSLHSAYANLAPEGGVLIHAAKYLPPGRTTDPREDEREIEAFVDLVQPGWRDQVIVRRFLPNLTATSALVTAEAGGLAGRPGPAIPEIPGLYVAGDWVGADGLLADAALASAKEAAKMIIRRGHVPHNEREAHAVA